MCVCVCVCIRSENFKSHQERILKNFVAVTHDHKTRKNSSNFSLNFCAGEA